MTTAAAIARWVRLAAGLARAGPRPVTLAWTAAVPAVVAPAVRAVALVVPVDVASVAERPGPVAARSAVLVAEPSAGLGVG